LFGACAREKKLFVIELQILIDRAILRLRFAKPQDDGQVAQNDEHPSSWGAKQNHRHPEEVGVAKHLSS